MKRTLEDLFLDSVADLCHAEIQLTKAVPKIARAARDVELRQALEQHLVETEGHIHKLEEIFGTFGARPRLGKCVAIAGIIREAEEVVSVNKRSSVIDAAIIYAVQKVEHYEIASFGTLRAWARYLEKDGVADLIDEILDREKYADERLTELAEMQCNESAISDERRHKGEYADWA